MLNFEQKKDAEAIANEIIQAWNAGDSDLGKHREMGYMADIGSPDDWWESNCKAYSIASAKYPKAKEFAAVCSAADEILNNVQ